MQVNGCLFCKHVIAASTNTLVCSIQRGNHGLPPLHYMSTNGCGGKEFKPAHNKVRHFLFKKVIVPNWVIHRRHDVDVEDNPAKWVAAVRRILLPDFIGE